MPLSPGQILNNRYRIVKLLGQGGYGVVYKAWDMNLNLAFAIKENLDTSPEAQRQFAREATLLANLHHPNLPRVIDHFILPGQGQYLVMDYVEGEDLQSRLDRTGGPLPEATVLPWVSQVCDALSYMHTQNPPVIHRDIKPANIKISLQGQAMLVDFGIAKVYDPNLKTTLGARAVTPGYSPPEQYGQGTTDRRSDIYSLGATLYTLLTGQAPTESVQRTLGATLLAPCLLNSRLNLTTENAILRALAVLPRDRYQSMAQFVAALLPPPVIPTPANPPPGPVAVPYPPTPRRIPWRWILGGALVLALFFLGGWAVQYFTSEASAITPAPTLDPGSFQISDKDGMKVLYVPAGEFLMGSINSDSQALPNEKPQHTVYLGAFWIDQTEVTNAMYRLCVQAGLCQAPSETTYYADTQFGNYPVVDVSWNDAQAYCQWTGRQLPTEAQWEKAARGIDDRLYPWGNSSFTGNLANFCDINCTTDWIDKTINDGYAAFSPVGNYPAGASPYGALDMAGNVWEWVADWFGENYYASSPSSNPTGPVAGQYRVIRGGSWLSVAQNGRAAFRTYFIPDYRGVSYGFRCSH